ncbi:hypothetical protein AN964_21145 [Heyndrickxia shackletonii]|uniref:Uncharacterized protein n=1 Tax=Heyndrickxia shackletonii TaxID=157838 RepID=A0A0Q3WT37_9BACI|nr:hypothetical protein [Heyndrickxia shackletonii]KQL51471.1 hypothetical protein AN964_21145 [Heyndrickxia shackletonii]NEZ02410.1 hypothetical protein [Heyndrickxia shackletonii]
MILLWIAKVLTFGYGALSTLAGSLQCRKRNIPTWSAIGMTIVGIIVMVSSIFVNIIPNSIIILIFCFVLLHILSIANGNHLYGKINIKHHIIRLLFSLVIVLLYIV